MITHADLLHEMLVEWPAWQMIVAHVSRSDAETADPHSIYGSACATDRDRLVALLYAYRIGDTMIESREILERVLRLAQDGRRPRYGRELLGDAA